MNEVTETVGLAPDELEGELLGLADFELLPHADTTRAAATASDTVTFFLVTRFK